MTNYSLLISLNTCSVLLLVVATREGLIDVLIHLGLVLLDLGQDHIIVNGRGSEG